MEASAEAAFVLVAGGLGERLGYSGIKIALPTDLASGACFLQVLPPFRCILRCTLAYSPRSPYSGPCKAESSGVLHVTSL